MEDIHILKIWWSLLSRCNTGNGNMGRLHQKSGASGAVGFQNEEGGTLRQDRIIAAGFPEEVAL